MDDKRFDSLTRQVGQQADRRTMVKTALGGALAVLGIGVLDQQGEARTRNKSRRNRRENETGYEGDECLTGDDCLTGLVCRGARPGVAPGFPTPIGIPAITGSAGTCKYRDNCGGERGDACRRNDDCCDDDNLICDKDVFRCRPND